MHPLIREDLERIIDSDLEVLSAFEGKTILIAGGSGFLGNYLTAFFLSLNEKKLRKPCRVIVLDNFITGLRENSLINTHDNPHFELIEHDVCRPLPDLAADYVIHAAGLASPHYYQEWPLETIDVAVTGTKNMLEFARKRNIAGFLYFSSSEVYGDPPKEALPTPESYWGHVSSTGPRACYDESKRLGETLTTLYHQLYAVPVKIVRPFNVYGPGMRTDDYRVIPTLMTRGISGQSLLVHDTGEQTRTFCYITDAIQGFLKVLVRGASGGIYNVGSDDGEMSIVHLATLINEILPQPVEVDLVRYPDSYPAGEPRRRCPDLTKIKSELGFEPHVRLRQGLERTRDWYLHLLSNEKNSSKSAQTD